MSSKVGVEVKPSGISGAGRGLFARQAFAPGDVVLSLDRPMVAELREDRLLDTCGWCFQRGAIDPLERAQAASMGLPLGTVETKSCTGCRRVAYCSRNCQSKAWKREHKYECKILAPSTRPDIPLGIRAVIKLLGRLKANPEEGAKVLDILDFAPFSQGRGLDEFTKKNKQRSEDYHFLGGAAWEYCGQPEEIANVGARSVATGLAFNILCNILAIGSPLDNIELGSSFDPLLCSANHSCEPNVVAVTNNPDVVLRALKPIKKGEELFMKYIDVTDPFPLRQMKLEREYGFICQCSRCSKGLSGDEPLRKPAKDLSAEYCKKADAFIAKHAGDLPQTTDIAQHRLAALHAEALAALEGPMGDPATIKDAIALCINSGLWNLTTQPVPQLCDRYFATLLETVDIYRAFRLGVKMYFEINPKLDPQPFHPHRLIHTWTLGTMTNVLCGPAFRTIQQEFEQSGLPLQLVYLGFLFDVHENTQRMYGWDTSFGKVVKSTYDQILAGFGRSEADIKPKIEAMWPTLETFAKGLDILNL